MATAKTSPVRRSKTATAAATKTKPSKSKAPAQDATQPGATATSVIDALGHPQIEQRAFEIWQRKGCPLGCDRDNWLEAEKELISECVTRKRK